MELVDGRYVWERLWLRWEVTLGQIVALSQLSVYPLCLRLKAASVCVTAMGDGADVLPEPALLIVCVTKIGEVGW